jgi:L-ribulose-5-phosphate 3-epimerase
MPTKPARRSLLKGAGLVALAGPALAAPAPERPAAVPGKAPLFKISLAEWSLHRTLQAGHLDNLDFPRTASALGFDAVEYVNQFFKKKARDRAYLADLKRRAAGEGVWSVLIMIDGEGSLGASDAATRTQAVQDHQPWIEAAATLGCHAIRVNAHGDGAPEEHAKQLGESLRRLAELGEQHAISVIVENHGGLSSNGAWLSQVIKAVGHPRCGTLPDFGNFKIAEGQEYDRYKGVQELAPFARSFSAKSHDFDRKGNEVHTDYLRMMKIVAAAGYHGYVGVEYEGKALPEIDGVLATKKLLERVRGHLAAA